MPSVPAICRTCGTVFPSGIVVENSRDVTLAGNTAGPCPNCGGMGEIPDGVYDFVGNTVRVVAASGYSRNQLQRVAAVVLQARAAGAPASDVVANLEREAPELAELARRLLVPRTPADLTGWLMLLLVVLQMLIAKPTSDLDEKEIERLTEQAIERAVETPGRPGEQPGRRVAPPPGAKRPPLPPRKQREARKRARKRR